MRGAPSREARKNRASPPADTAARITSVLETQETVTRDGVPVKVNAVLWFRAKDSTRVITTVANWQGAVIQAAETAMRRWTRNIAIAFIVLTLVLTFVGAHLGAVLPFAQWPAVNCMNNYADDLLVEPLTVQGGTVKVPEAPGIGIEVDEGALTRFRMAAAAPSPLAGEGRPSS